ncbi:MAG TPA: tetratricopeptide repeat protein [Pyrinomonadaceae bacterium]|jgi:tetratricopeptide (TPR) repeat protein
MPDTPSLNARTLAVGAACLVLGFVAGFFVTNSINRDEQEKLRAEVATLRASGAGGEKAAAQPGGRPSDAASGKESFPTLTDEQLSNAVKQADASPSDAELQNKVGQALYFYAWEKGNEQILPDVGRILKRAHALDPKNYRTAVLAGDAHFLLANGGGGGGNAAALAESRKFYQDALALKPDDAQVRTNLGRTYFYDKPSDPRRAISEYRRALQSDPKLEMSVQSLAAALIETGGFEEAGRRLDELEKLNPSNPELANLRAQLEQKRNAAKEKQ